MSRSNWTPKAGLGPAFRIVFFSALAGVAVLAGAESDRPDHRLAWPLAVILLHALWSWRYRANAALLAAAGYQTYFLGFLSTVLSILVAIVRVSENPKLVEDTHFLCVSIGMALASTVVALVAMNALSACAESLEARLAGTQPQTIAQGVEMLLASLATSKVPPLLEKAVADFRQLILDLQQSVAAARGLGGELEQVAPTVQRLDDQLQVLLRSLEALAAATGRAQMRSAEYSASVQQIQQVIDGVVALLQSKIDTELRHRQQGRAA